MGSPVKFKCCPYNKMLKHRIIVVHELKKKKKRMIEIVLKE